MIVVRVQTLRLTYTPYLMVGVCVSVSRDCDGHGMKVINLNHTSAKRSEPWNTKPTANARKLSGSQAVREGGFVIVR